MDTAYQGIRTLRFSVIIMLTSIIRTTLRIELI